MVSYKQAAAPSAKKHPPVPVAYSGNKLKQDDIAYIGLENNSSKDVCMIRNSPGFRISCFDFTEPQITKFPMDTTVIEGEGVYFRIKVSGKPQPTVTWYHNGEPVRADYANEIESDGSLAIPSTELKHSGVYKAVATNHHGSEEREIKLMVKEEGGASTALAIGDMVSSRPVPIHELGKYVAELHANLNQPLIDLYQVCHIKFVEFFHCFVQLQSSVFT